MGEELFVKDTKRGREVYGKLQMQIINYNEGVYGLGKASPKVESFIADLSEDDFYWLMRLPIGNIARSHYTAMRKRILKEREYVLLVYYGNKENKEVTDFYEFLRSEDFVRVTTGPINSSDCPWVYVFLEKKEFKIGKPGIDFASKRLIKHSVLIEDFFVIYNYYKITDTLDGKKIKSLIKKYNNYSIFCFNTRENIGKKIRTIKNKIISTIKGQKFKYYYNKYKDYEEYKNKVLLCMVTFNGYPSKEGAMIDYKYYEKELYDEFMKHKEFNPSTTAYYISMGY